MKANIVNNIYENYSFPLNANKNLLPNSNKLECNNEYKFSEINNNNISIGNNINIDLLSKVHETQNKLNNELHEVKKIYIPYSSNNKKEYNSHLSFHKEKKVNNEYSRENNKKKVINIKNNKYKNSNYKDIPITKFFQ